MTTPSLDERKLAQILDEEGLCPDCGYRECRCDEGRTLDDLQEDDGE